MSEKGRSSVILLVMVSGLLLAPLGGLALAARFDRIDKDALDRRIALLQATTVDSPASLQTRYRAAREQWLPILPPDPEFRLNPSEGILVFDPANFRWAEALEPAELNGVTVYPVTVVEDPETRYTAFYNGSAELVGYLAPEQDYVPFAWLAETHPAFYAENADPDALAWAAALADPARVSMTFYLLPADSMEAMAAAQLAAESQEESSVMRMRMGEGLPEPATNLVIFAIEPTTNGTALGIGWPDDFTNKLEVFARATIATTGWFVASTNLSTAGTNSLWWVDTALSSNTEVRFYRVGNADQDSDSDGLTDARERMMYGTDAGNEDSDLDGFTDYQEVIFLRTDPNNNDTNKPIVTITFPANNGSWVWVP